MFPLRTSPSYSGSQGNVREGEGKFTTAVSFFVAYIIIVGDDIYMYGVFICQSKSFPFYNAWRPRSTALRNDEM